MKQNFMKVFALIVAMIIIVCAIPSVTVVAVDSQSTTYAQPTTYSKEYNSGQRDVVCTTLSGTSASSYYTGSYTYENLSKLSASSLKSSLATLMKSTHKKISSYDNCRDMALKTDCENEDGRVLLIYTSYSATMSQYNGWNREHVWPKSLGGNNTSGGGADLHHIRPSDAGVNSSRGNKPYGESGSGATEKYGSNPATGYLGGTYNSTYFEPLDNVKGDVARICLYVWIRWGSEWGADRITEVFQSEELLLEWMELDPVDTWEMGRNEVVQAYQGNRNVFIDYPEYAWMILGEDVPSDMVTPSGKASNGTAGGNTGGSTGSTTEKETESETETKPVTPSNNGTLASPLTVTEAYNANKGLAEGSASSDPFYIKGNVTKIGETGSYYKNVYISDGKTEILIYTLNLSNGISGIEVGDTITVYGYFKNYFGTIEMATNSGTYVEVVKLHTGTVTPPATETETDPPETETETEPPVQSGNGTLEAPLTPTAAYNANKGLAEGSVSSNPFYVKGNVTKIGETGSYYKNVYISDGKTEILIYTLNLSNGISGIEVGDTITVHGYFKNYFGTIEMATNSGTYVEVVKLHTGTVTPPETETEPVTEPVTEPDSETEPVTEPTTEPGKETETSDNTVPGTESGSETSSDTGSNIETETPGITDGESDPSSETQTPSETSGGSVCGVSIAGGALTVSIISIFAFITVRKKED